MNVSLARVERSGAGITEAVNPAMTRFIQVKQDSTLREPSFQFHGTDFWAQGITFGLTATY